jgi:NADH-quinone oxidoreductase subunit L
MTAFTAPWVILFAPLVAAALILFFGRLGKKFSSGLAIATAALTAILSWFVHFAPTPEAPLQFFWIDLRPFSFNFAIPIGLVIDPLSQLMLLVVTNVATLVFIYSVGYMATEEGYSRFFGALCLFLFSMLGIVLADNFVMMFIFWELVGVSSYILIGHYFGKNSAAEAAKQAFTVNRVGDFGFLLGIILLWVYTGTFQFADMAEKTAPLAAGSPATLALALILIFCGTIGKSAQMPLHVWLPNSMEGPTPVSSLLHAATMVAAGVYMLARIFPILEMSPTALLVIAWVGGITCFVAGLMGIQQADIKRILAYSTISQLGYMVLAIGVAGNGDVAMFHLVNHAFFKCLLFLAAGSVIVGLHHEQNIWKMGGLKNKMPITFLVMGSGALALSGVPPFSGYFSKDLIIEWAWANNMPLFWVSAAAVTLTALYTFRLYLVVFFGAPRSDAARHAHESPKVMLLPMAVLAVLALISGWPPISKLYIHPAHPENVPFTAHLIIYGFLLLGLVIAFLLYLRGPKADPVRIPAFEHRLYIDDAYNWLVRVVQGGFAGLCSFVDRWVIDGVVKLCAVFAWGSGFALRLLQVGNIQVYAFFFGAGILLLFYLLLAK